MWEKLSHTVHSVIYRQLPHVVRCWPQPVAVCRRQGFFCAERTSLCGQPLRWSFVIRLAFHARESHLSGLLSDKWLTLSEIKMLFLLPFFDIHKTKIASRWVPLAYIWVQMTWKLAQQWATEEKQPEYIFILEMQSTYGTEEALQHLADSSLAKEINKCDFLFQGCMLLREQHHVFSLAGPIPIKAYFFFSLCLSGFSRNLLFPLTVQRRPGTSTLAVGLNVLCAWIGC